MASTTTELSPVRRAAVAAARAADAPAVDLGVRWGIADDLVEASAGGGDVTDVNMAVSDHRVVYLDLALSSTTALLAAVGGRGMNLSHPAQRLARGADFDVIQAQTSDGRAATLRSVAAATATG